MKRLLIGFAVGSLVITGFAQVTTPTGLPGAALKTQTSATTATTLFLIPDTNQSIYLYEIDIQNCAGASAVTAAAVTTVATTNIDGGLAWTVGSGVGAGLCTNQVLLYPTGLKAQAVNQPVTIILPAFATNQTIRVNAAYRSAP